MIKSEAKPAVDFEPFPHNHFAFDVFISVTEINCPIASSFHSGFKCWEIKMFGRVIKNIIRKELLGKSQSSQKILTRALLTSQISLYRHHLADNENDIIVYSPMPSLTYPDYTIDEFVWKDFNKWSSKTALVSWVFVIEKYSQQFYDWNR